MALVFGIVAIVTLLEGQWAAFGICLLLCGIFLPLAKRHRQMRERSSEARPSTRHLDPGISQELSQIMEAAGVSKSYASNIRAGRYTPHVSTWMPLALFAGITPNGQSLDKRRSILQ